MDEKHAEDQVTKGLDRLEEVEVSELTDNDLDSVAGGIEESGATVGFAADTCNSSWCCSNGG